MKRKIQQPKFQCGQRVQSLICGKFGTVHSFHHASGEYAVIFDGGGSEHGEGLLESQLKDENK